MSRLAKEVAGWAAPATVDSASKDSPAWRATALVARRGCLAAMGSAMLLSACGGPATRMEATVHWAGSDHAFTTGLPRFDPARSMALLLFLSRPLAVEEVPAQADALEASLATSGQPWLVLELVFRESGRASFDNLRSYAVRIGGGGAARLRVERRASDWVRDGGIDLSGEARPGGRLLGRLRRAGVDASDAAGRAWRWDIGFDTVLAAA